MSSIQEIEALIKDKSAEEMLLALNSLSSESIVFSTSLGYEDQVITDLIFKNDLAISVFTLDTGRLFPETYSVLDRTLAKYKKPIKVYAPQANLVEDLTSTKGPYSFYESLDNRKECCYIRKVEPLKRALKGATIWITGIRVEQSNNRNHNPIVEWDESNNIIKVHPILHWTLDEVKSYINQNNIPYNSLHDKGFVSIGCQPCTRAIKEGEDFRAGRWWWEDNSKKECGLHSHSN